MIVFDLACANGHVFEAWFASQDDYAAQQARGLVVCPMCEDRRVEKAPMAPRLARTRAPVPQAREGGAPAPEREAALRALAALQARMLAGSEHVGARFAEEARAMHEGEAESRAIHGQATLGEARALVADGIDILPLPLPVRGSGRDN
ncbi:DUF1178 family protein [Sphingomonas morindae]|uniref:DUF1178 family protein n=1 Tax=Sphingomonas morindae TaxID=1541170 RepID=A0ABY4X5M1_9SPHN|nr:DUF1178 family protein [Sphingomonas morindae]USI72208.1 DUF1178 family protein [Sphingomonas morindae]